MKQTPTLFQRPMVQAIVRELDPKTQTRRHVKGEALDWLEPYNFTPEFVALPENKLSPYGYAGDQIYVKETFFAWGRWETRFNAKKGRDEWHFVDMTLETGHAYCYAADGAQPALLATKRDGGVTPKWWKRPAIFMPRAAVRIWLEVVSVRIERLQEISEADADAEGCERLYEEDPGFVYRDGDNPDWKVCPKCGGTRLHNALGANLGVIFDVDCQECNTYIKRYRHLWTAINGAEDWAANPWVWVVSFKRITGATQ